MASNKAKELLWPTDSNILVRFVFLYVGQGLSTIILIRNKDTYKSLIADINLDAENGGINVPVLMSDLLEESNLDVFINTHPHDDHLKGIIELSDEININEVWHSGHKPGKKYDDAYRDLMIVVDKVKKQGGNERKLKGSKEEQLIGEAKYYILSPAKYVTDDISDEDADTRYRRIHEQCAVLKFGMNKIWGILPGDADRDAFEKHITNYHRERLVSAVLAASHHGSRTFFRYKEEDEPCLDSLNTINPDYVIISAPQKSESKYGHPDDDAVEFYQDKVGKQNVLHTGENRYSYICDIYDDGSYSGVFDDKGELAESYPIDENKRRTPPTIITHTRVDDRGMGGI